MMNNTGPILNILLVDDDAEDQEMFAEALSKSDIPFTLKILDRCTELVSLIESQKDCFDIIFLDINLPLMDGIECLRVLKTNDSCKNVPVIIFSMSDSISDVDKVYSLGAHYHIVKPYAQINLVATLKIIFSVNWKLPQPIPPKEKFLINMTFNS